MRYQTGVAQRKRAGLIIPRTLVRTQPPVLSSWTLNAATFTDVAQRDARGAHNSKVTGSTPVVGIYFLRLCFTEAGRLDADVKCILLYVELDVKRSNLHRRGAEVSARGS